MHTPLVSIIIPAHNMRPWLGGTLASVLAQTVKDWECIIIDDGSSDGTGELARSCDDNRIRVLRQEQSGVSAARNVGLAEARGEFITFLDADDLWHPKALEWMLEPLLGDPACAFAWVDFVRFEDGTRRYMPLPGTHLQHTGDLWLDLLVDNFLPIGAFCLRAKLAKAHIFDSSLVIAEDWDWLLRVVKGAPTAHVTQVAHYYRQRKGSAMRDIERFLRDEATILDRHLRSSDVPDSVRRRARSGQAFHAAVLLAKRPGMKLQALRQYAHAIVLDPLYLENFLRPLRKLWWHCFPPGKVVLPGSQGV